MSPDPNDLSFLVRDDAGIRAILDGSRTIAVVGLSSDPMRPSHDVASYLQRVGYRILPVNPKETEVLGERAYKGLKDVREKIDVVDVFRRPDQVAPIVEEAIAVGARVLWLQEGVVDPASARRAHDAGLTVVMDRCMLREHSRLMR